MNKRINNRQLMQWLLAPCVAAVLFSSTGCGGGGDDEAAPDAGATSQAPLDQPKDKKAEQSSKPKPTASSSKHEKQTKGSEAKDTASSLTGNSKHSGSSSAGEAPTGTSQAESADPASPQVKALPPVADGPGFAAVRKIASRTYKKPPLDDAFKVAPGTVDMTIEVLGNGFSKRDLRGAKVSPDKSKVAWLAGEGSKPVVMLNNQRVGVYDRVLVNTIQFTPDSSKLVFHVTMGAFQHIVLVEDGVAKVSPPYTYIRKLEVPRQGGLVVWIGETREGSERSQRVVVNGKPGPEADHVSGLTFSEDGKHYAYLMSRNTQPGKREIQVVLDGVPGPAYENISSNQEIVLLRSPLRAAYLAGRSELGGNDLAIQDAAGNTKVVQKDVIVQFRGQNNRRTLLALSPERDHYAAVSLVPKAEDTPANKYIKPVQVFVDGEARTGQFREVFAALLSSGGKTLLTQAIPLSGGNQALQGIYKNKDLVISSQQLSSPCLSPDGQRIAYMIRGQNGTFLVLDGKEIGPLRYYSKMSFAPDGTFTWHGQFDGQNEHAIFFDDQPIYSSPNGVSSKWELYQGDELGVLARANDRWVVGREPGPGYGNIGELVWSDNRKHFAYSGAQVDEQTGKATPVFVVDHDKVYPSQRSGNGIEMAVSNEGVVASVQYSNERLPENKTAYTVAVNGYTTPLFEQSDLDPGLHFPEPGKAAFYGVKGESLCRFVVDIPAAEARGKHLAASQADNPVRFLHEFRREGGGHTGTDLFVADDGTLYGVSRGGEYKNGLVFSLSADGAFNEIKALPGGNYSGENPEKLLLGPDGELIGQDSKGIFRVMPNGAGFTYLSTDERLYRSVTLSDIGPDGLIYAADISLNNRDQKLFAIDPKSGQVTPLWPSKEDLEKNDNGLILPEGPVAYLDGKLYTGTVRPSGIARFDARGEGYEVVHEMKGPPFDISYLRTPLIVGPDKRLHAISSNGGENSRGFVLSMNPDGSDYKVVSFKERVLGSREATVLGPDGHWYAVLHKDYTRTVDVPALVRINPEGQYDLVQKLPADMPVPTVLALGPDGRIYGMTGDYRVVNTLFVIDPLHERMDGPEPVIKEVDKVGQPMESAQLPAS